MKRPAPSQVEKGKSKGGSRMAKASTVKNLGEFEGDAVALATGRYGFYLKAGKDNVALPNEYKKDEEKALSLTLAEAVELIRTKRAKD